MPTHANVLMQHTPVAPGNIRYLPLRSASVRPAPKKRDKPVVVASVLSVAVHAVVFFAVVIHRMESTETVAETPMMVSLLTSPPAEAMQKAPPVPKQPITKPHIQRQEQPEPQPDKSILQPQPLRAESAIKPAAAATQAVTPPPPSAVASNATESAEPQPAEKAEQAPEPAVEKSEPRIEPPRYGVAYLNNPPPAYPPISKRLGEQGRVILKVLVSAEGDPQTVDLDTGSGSDRLDHAAIEAVKKWRFVPAKRDGQLLSAYVLVQVNFNLQVKS